MYNSGSKVEFLINKVDNGFILRWEKEALKGQALYESPRGTEVLADQDSLIARINELLAPDVTPEATEQAA